MSLLCGCPDVSGDFESAPHRWAWCPKTGRSLEFWELSHARLSERRGPREVWPKGDPISRRRPQTSECLTDEARVLALGDLRRDRRTTRLQPDHKSRAMARAGPSE